MNQTRRNFVGAFLACVSLPGIPIRRLFGIGSPTKADPVPEGFNEDARWTIQGSQHVIFKRFIRTQVRGVVGAHGYIHWGMGDIIETPEYLLYIDGRLQWDSRTK